jgi:hypothetical protein
MRKIYEKKNKREKKFVFCVEKEKIRKTIKTTQKKM